MKTSCNGVSKNVGDCLINGRSFKENGLETRQPCRVECHLMTVSQGRDNVPEGSRLRKVVHN
eukprot:5183967-Pleurochrysis_carterae.AAC.1